MSRARRRHAPRRGRRAPRRRRPASRWRALLVVAALIAELSGVWARAHRFGGHLVVRCRRGHLFTTLWIPGVSAKALRLGPRRLQRCPVGGHWSWVTPVDERRLSVAERDAAHARHDRTIP